MYLIRSGAIEGFEQLVRELGHNPNQLLHAVGFKSAHLREPNTYVAYSRMADLLDEAAHATQDLLFGLRLASSQNILVLGELGLSASRQETLGEALQFAQKHLHLHAHGIQLSQTIEDEWVNLGVSFHFTNSNNLRQLKQLSVVQIVNTLQYLLGGSYPSIRICLRQSKITQASHVGLALRDRVEFSSSFDGVKFPASVLRKTPNQTDEFIREHFNQRMLALQARYPDNIAAKTKHIISSLLPSGECKIENVAAALNLHPRLLQMQLKNCGTKYGELLQQSRLEISQQHLQFGELSITELALNLGYAEVSVFTRNFKSWTGESPSRWRKKHKQLM